MSEAEPIVPASLIIISSTNVTTPVDAIVMAEVDEALPIVPPSLMRISSEFSSLRTNLPNNWDTSIVVRACSDNLNIFSFVITGPKDNLSHAPNKVSIYSSEDNRKWKLIKIIENSHASK